MKISYRTHPVLGLINGVNHTVSINPNAVDRTKIMKGLSWVFDKYKEDLNKNVTIVSQPFAEAASLCNAKMIGSELYKEIGDELRGVLILGAVSIIYDAKRTTVNGIGAWRLNIIEFFAGDALKTFAWEGITKYTDISTEVQTPDFAVKSIWNFVQMVIMFKKFAQVEIKEIAAGQKVKGIDCNYKNETKSNVQFLNSAWFTTLVKSDAFKVRGHFRLQPKIKEGKWTKELIWINEFQKEGYTAPARKLQIQN